MTDRWRTYHLDPDEIVDQPGDPARLIPEVFPNGGGMKRFVTDPFLEYRAGHTKVSAGQTFETFFWYDEFWVIRSGQGHVTATDRVTGEVVESDLGPMDTVFIGRGCHIVGKATSEEPWVFFYVAIPASNRDAAVLAHMTEADLHDVRKRHEYS